MRRIVLVLLVCVFAFTVSGCSADETLEGNESSQNKASTSTVKQKPEDAFLGTWVCTCTYEGTSREYVQNASYTRTYCLVDGGSGSFSIVKDDSGEVVYEADIEWDVKYNGYLEIWVKGCKTTIALFEKTTSGGNAAIEKIVQGSWSSSLFVKQ